MKQKKRRVKLFNPLTEEVEEILINVKYDLTSCPLPSDIDDLTQSIFNSLLDSIPKIDPDLNLDIRKPINAQLINKLGISSNGHKDNDINFDNFWKEWLKFRASIWSLSSISVVDDIYESYVKERLDELKIIIENVESKEQLLSPTIKYEFKQISDLVDKSFLNLHSIIIDPIDYGVDYDEDEYNNINREKEQKRIKDLMTHRTQIRRIRDDFSARYKNFFQLSNQERSITDVQHRRCISIIEEMLNALNKLSKQQKNFNCLKDALYLAERKLMHNVIPPSNNVSVVPIYKDQNKNLVLPEDAESVYAESIISNLLSSRSNSPYNSPLNSPNKQVHQKQLDSPIIEKNNSDNKNYVTPVKKQERKWKTPEPQVPPAVIQPLSLHEFSGVPDSFKDLSRRFNTSDSDYLSTPTSPDNKRKQQNQNLIQQGQSQTPKKGNLINSEKKNQKQKTVVFAKDQTPTRRKSSPLQSAIKKPQQQPQSIKDQNEEIESKNKIDSLHQQNYTTQTIENETNEYDDKATSLSTSSYTSDDEDPATVSRSSKLAAILSPNDPTVDEINKEKSKLKENEEQNKPKSPSQSSSTSISSKDKNKKRKNSDPVLLHQQHQQQQKIKQKESVSNQFDSSFLRPKRKSSDYDINATSSIFSSSSKLNRSLDNISIKSKSKMINNRTKASSRHSESQLSSSSSAPTSPQNPQLKKASSFSNSSPVINRNKIFKDDQISFKNKTESEVEEEEYFDNRDELTKLKDDYETLLVQLNVYSEENRELQAANEEIPFLKKKIDFYEELEIFYEDEIQRLYQTVNSLSKRINKNSKDESTYLENSRLHREKDQLFSKLQNVQKELSALSSKSKSSNELLFMLREEKEKNEKLRIKINELTGKASKGKKTKNEEEEEKRRTIFEKQTEVAKQQIKMQNLNLKILHLKSKVKRYKIRLNNNESNKTKESKEIEKLENEIAAIRNSFESIQDLRFNQQDELLKEQTKNDFLQSTIDKLNGKIENPAFDIESDVMNELKEKIQENRNLKDENEKVKSTLFELYHLICGEALTDDVDDVTILLDGIRQHLV